jgi:hypothetical protein
MSPAELKKELAVSIKEYDEARTIYRQHLLQYAFSLLVAEIAVVGFLLQNQTTNQLLNQHFAKYILLSSIYICFLSIFLSMLAKRNYKVSQQAKLHSYHYKALSKVSTLTVAIDGMETEAIEDGDVKSLVAIRKSWKLSNLVKQLYFYSEVALGIAVFLALIFVTTLLVN